jgi:hypothetical protein
MFGNEKEARWVQVTPRSFDACQKIMQVLDRNSGFRPIKVEDNRLPEADISYLPPSTA